MSDPCKGLSVRMCERKNDGPSAKMMHKNRNISASTISYTIQATPGVEFGIIIKVKEDFDFKGSEGLRITISINDDGWGDTGRVAVGSPREQSWYVDALSKWSGRQVFHAFEHAADSTGNPAHKQEFTMPHPPPNSDSSHYAAWLVSVMDSAPEGCITVRVERGNLFDGAILSHRFKKSYPEEVRREQKRSTKLQIDPTHFDVLLGMEGLAAIYEFRNTGVAAVKEPIPVMSTALPTAKLEKPQQSVARAQLHATLSAFPSTPETLPSLFNKGIEHDGPKLRQTPSARKNRPDRFASKHPKDNFYTYSPLSPLGRDSDQIGEYERSTEALNKLMEETSVEPKAPTKHPLSQVLPSRFYYNTLSYADAQRAEADYSSASVDKSKLDCCNIPSVRSMAKADSRNRDGTVDPDVESHVTNKQQFSQSFDNRGVTNTTIEDIEAAKNILPLNHAALTKCETPQHNHAIALGSLQRYVPIDAALDSSIASKRQSSKLGEEPSLDSLVDTMSEIMDEMAKKDAASGEAASKSQIDLDEHQKETGVENGQQEESEIEDDVSSIEIVYVNTKEDSDYVLVDEPARDKPPPAGCVCS